MSSLGESGFSGVRSGLGVDSEFVLSSERGGRVWEWREGLGELLEGAFAACFVGEILIVSRLRGHE